MISAFNDMKKVRRFHFRAHIFEKIERTKWITRSLHKEDRRSQSAQNFIAKFCAITGGAKRIAETNDCIHLFLQRDMASDASAHALANENGRNTCRLSRRGKHR